MLHMQVQLNIIFNEKSGFGMYKITPLKKGEVIPQKTSPTKFRANTAAFATYLSRERKPIRIVFRGKNKGKGVVLRPVQG